MPDRPVNSRALLFLLWLAIPLVLPAQDMTTRRSGDDRIEKFDDWVIVKAALVNTSETLVAETDSLNIVLQPNPSELFRAYFNYRIISFYVNYVPHFLPGNNDEREKGRSKSWGLGTTLSFRDWSTDLNFYRTRGYYLRNTKDFRPGWKPGEPYLQFPDLYVTSFEGTTVYNTNPHLSLPALTSQTERQLRSAGSFMPRISYRYYIIDDRTPGASYKERSKHFQALLGAGYHHVFVLRRSLFLHGGFTPSFGYIFSRVETSLNGEKISSSQRGPLFQWDARLGFGYNGHRLFSGAYLTATSSKHAQGLSTAVEQEASIYFQLFLGLRFRAPGLLRKHYPKILP